jgi:hypothetical protein
VPPSQIAPRLFRLRGRRLDAFDPPPIRVGCQAGRRRGGRRAWSQQGAAPASVPRLGRGHEPHVCAGSMRAVFLDLRAGPGLRGSSLVTDATSDRLPTQSVLTRRRRPERPRSDPMGTRFDPIRAPWGPASALSAIAANCGLWALAGTSRRADGETRTPDPFITSDSRALSRVTRDDWTGARCPQSPRLCGLDMTRAYRALGAPADTPSACH